MSSTCQHQFKNYSGGGGVASPPLCTILQDSASTLGHPWGLLNPKTQLAEQLVSSKAEPTPR